MKKIEVIIADDHRLFADGLTTILEQTRHVEVVACAYNGQELLKLLAVKTPQVVILDVSMPLMNGLEAAEHIKKLYPEVKILMVTMNDSIDVVRLLMDTGVHGIVLKNTGKTELVFAIEEINNGNTYYSQKITQHLAGAYNLISQDKWQLTKREREVLQLIYEGFSTSGIAEKLFISAYTVETHKKNLFIKSGVNKSALLVKLAQELGYIRKNGAPF